MTMATGDKDATDTTVNTITYKYDRAGRLLRTTDNIGTTRNTYDNAGRLTQVAYPGGRTVAYQYDAANNRTRLTYPDSTYVTYEYDALNRLRIVRNQAGTILAQYNFDWRSRRENLSYANGARIEYLYDVANRMISVDNIANSGSHEYAYGYDNVGNRTSMTVTNGGTEVHQYVYDGTYQVKDVDYPAGYGNGFTDTEFNYDAAGNRTTVIDASGTTTYQSNSLNQYSSVGGLSYTYDTSGNMTYDGDGQTYAYDPENRLTTVQKVPDPLAAACDIALNFTTSGAANWFSQTAESYNGNDAVQSGDIGDNQETVLEATVPGTGTVTFWWKTSTQVGDEAAFYIDGVWKAGRSGISGWNSVSQTITTAGTHTLRWKYMKDSSGSSGSDCIWVDYVQWTGTMPSLGSWSTIAYTYDANGRRIERKVDGTTQVKYVYDGDHIIAEYNNAGTLLRKYVHGPSVDRPICMIESAGSYAGTYYYHYDGLGSVVGLTNSAGNMVELYEYSVYGQVAASDENHPNRFMFTGREFDKDTGLYYYRARYYHPEVGRFLQSDPVGYKAGMNLYRYCKNIPSNMVDPFGNDPCLDANGPNTPGPNDTNGWSPDWTSYYKCMEDAETDLGRCRAQADGIMQDGLAACGLLLTTCLDGCSYIPRWIPLAREVCKVACVYTFAVLYVDCTLAVIAAYSGYTAGCYVGYATIGAGCANAFLYPPGTPMPNPAVSIPSPIDNASNKINNASGE